MSEHIKYESTESISQAKKIQIDELDSICVTIVEEVSIETGTDPKQMVPRLNDVIDTGALERLIESSSTETSLTFQFLDCRVTVFGDGSVVVTDPN